MNKTVFCSVVIGRKLNFFKFRSKSLNKYASQLFFFNDSVYYQRNCLYESTSASNYVHYSLIGAGILLGGYLLNKCNLKKLYIVNADSTVPLIDDVPISDDGNQHQEKASPFINRRERFNFIADIVEKNTPALVCIEVKDRFRLDCPEVDLGSVSGSGFIIDEDGLILTNAHVIMGNPNATIDVRLSNGNVYPGFVEDLDVRSDLATLRIQPMGKLPIMKLGSSKQLRPGEWVIAMGSPLSLSNTITAGVVSSVRRTSSELGLYGRDMDYIQTDAAITFGNSGGPLVNLDGEVVGINSMKVSTGISFAIPVDYAREFLNRKKNQKRAGVDKSRGYLGVTMLTLTKDLLVELQARNNRLPAEVTSGVLIWKVVVGSPAHKAGLIPGDVIVSMNDSRLKNVNQIYKALKKYSVLKFGVYRSDAYLEFTVYPENV